jgi:predicted RNA-binding protein associated with RNAse of E/G family
LEFGSVVVGDGYLAVWFLFRGRWYDVGKFYDRRRKFTGYYCDIIRPVARLLCANSKTSVITDLFLDLWISPQGKLVILDQEELENAVVRRIMSSALAARAKREMNGLVRMAKAGRFPAGWIQEYQPETKLS